MLHKHKWKRIVLNSYRCSICKGTKQSMKGLKGGALREIRKVPRL